MSLSLTPYLVAGNAISRNHDVGIPSGVLWLADSCLVSYLTRLSTSSPIMLLHMSQM